MAPPANLHIGAGGTRRGRRIVRAIGPLDAPAPPNTDHPCATVSRYPADGLAGDAGGTTSPEPPAPAFLGPHRQTGRGPLGATNVAAEPLQREHGGRAALGAACSICS